MAVLNYSKKCECCGGNRWQYRKDTKIWVCMYCGGQVERTEQYDGLYSIKNVVRQVILDSAYRRMEAAGRNLSECMKIDAQYPGTLIAAICYRMMAAISGAYSRQEGQAALGQLRRDYQMLNQQNAVLGDDETAVYEFLDSSDAWALLAVVFDAIGDKTRCDYLLTLVDYSQVFSKETNKSLLRFALKKNDMEQASKILAVPENVDVKDSLQIILSQGQSTAQKGELAAKLITAGALKPGDEEILNRYLESGDGLEAKIPVVIAACRKELKPQVPVLLRTVFADADEDALTELLDALFVRRMFDNELEAVMSFAAARSDFSACKAVLDAMVHSGQFISLNARQAEAFLTNTKFTAEERCSLVPVLSQLHAAERMWETVLGGCLINGRESGTDRRQLLETLCSLSKSVPAKDFEQYVLRCTGDGIQKADYIQLIFNLPEMNVGFFQKLASNYLVSGQDAPEVRSEILRKLLECGLSIDSSVLVQYVCTSGEDPNSMAELIQTALNSGTVLRSDALSIYLEKSRTFSPQIFFLLYIDGAVITRKAIENYVMRCPDNMAVKAQNASALAARMGVPLGSTECTFRFAGSSIQGTLAQCYLLTGSDPINLMEAMVEVMKQSGTQLNTNVRVDGRDKKFSKYVTEVRGQLSPQAEKICQDNRMFSRFFGF